VPAQFQRSDAEDLMAAVFPDQLACQDNLIGEREIPQHPLVEQTVNDCLNDLMDIAGLEEILHAYEEGRIRFHCRDLGGPSPLAQEILNARPYAFLDDAPAEERRTNAVIARRFLDPADAADLARLSPAAIDRVRNEAWPAYSNPDELYDALMLTGVMTEREINGANPAAADGRAWLAQLEEEQRATVIRTGKQTLWACAERLPQAEAVYTNAIDVTPAPPHATPANPAATPATSTATPAAPTVIPATPTVIPAAPTVIPAAPTVIPARAGIQSDNVPPEAAPYSANWTKEPALIELIRARLECCGPVTEAQFAELFEATGTEVNVTLLALQNEGYAMQGRFSPDAVETEWCERGLLARMHRYTIRSLRQEIQPVTAADYMRFLFAWHGMGEIRPEGDSALLAALEKLEGYSIPAAAWEKDILPARLNDYSGGALDRLCSSGRIAWARLPSARHKANQEGAPAGQAVLLRNTPIALLDREHLDLWHKLNPTEAIQDRKLSSKAEKTLDVLRRRGASFFPGPGSTYRPVAHAGGNGVGRTCRLRRGHLRQLRGVAGADHAGEQASRLRPEEPAQAGVCHEQRRCRRPLVCHHLRDGKP
jgi:ATP-dependent Lhr-like helicase